MWNTLSGQADWWRWFGTLRLSTLLPLSAQLQAVDVSFGPQPRCSAVQMSQSPQAACLPGAHARIWDHSSTPDSIIFLFLFLFLSNLCPV
ncbi:hypothetical protein JB92DRAFT_232622 [Gautieria morchelliformis]|nr:hypothetical protein JB92DRAFT_232622 [Gautieria morchelliformis]